MYRPGVNVDPWYENFKFFLTYWLLSNNRERITDIDQLPPPPPPPPTHNHSSANPFLPHKPVSAQHLKSSPTITSWENNEKHQMSPRQHSLQDNYNDLNMKSHMSPNGPNGSQLTQNNSNNPGFPPNHLLTDKDRRHVCPHCYKGFRSRQQLNQHNLVHSGVRKYHCLYCERAFKQLSHVQQHHRIHTGEKPYKCPLDGCDKAFAQMSNLQHHMRQHDKATFGQKHCMCPFCDRGYASEKSLKSHISKMHPDSKIMDFGGSPHPLLGSPQSVPGMSPRHSLPTMHPSMKSSLSPSGVGLGQGGPLELTVNSMSHERKSVPNDGRRYSVGNSEKFTNDVNSEMKLLQRSLSERHPDPAQEARNYLFDQRYGLSNNGHDMNKVGRPFDPFTSRFSHDLKQLTGKNLDLNEEKFQRMAEEFNDFRSRISMAPIHHFNRKEQMMANMFGDHIPNDRSQQITNREQLLFSAVNGNSQRHGDTPVNGRNYDLQGNRPNGVVMNRQNDIHQNNQYRLNMTDQDNTNVNRQNDENSEIRSNSLRLDSRNELPINRPDSLHRPYRNQDDVLLNRQNDNVHDNSVNTQNNMISPQDKLMMNNRNKMNGQDNIMMTSRSSMNDRQDDMLNGRQSDMMNDNSVNAQNNMMNAQDKLMMNSRNKISNGQDDIMLPSRGNMNGHQEEMMNGRQDNMLMGNGNNMEDLMMSPIRQTNEQSVIGMNSQLGLSGSQSNNLSPRNLLQSRQTDIDDIGLSSESTTTHAHDMRINSQTPVTNNNTNSMAMMSRNNEMNLSHENLNMNSQQHLPSRHANFDPVSQNGSQRMNGVEGIDAQDVSNGQIDFNGSSDLKRLSNGSQNGDSNMIRQRKRKPSNPQHVFMPSIDHYTGFPTEDMEDCSGLIIDVENGAGYENKMASRVDIREPMNCNRV